MAFNGTGQPKIELLDASGAGVVQSYTLPYPTNRPAMGWQREHDDRIAPLTKNLRKRNFGYRPVLTLFYAKIDQTDFEDLLEIANTSRLIRVIPHSDVTAISFLAEVTDFNHEYLSGINRHDSATIEFTGKSLIGYIPNIDTLYTATPAQSGTVKAVI